MVSQSLVDSVPPLAALPADVRVGLAEAFDEVDVPAGDRIATQGDFAYELFAILQGKARIEQDGVVVATIGPGELVGEIGLLLTGRRTASIVAETPMVLLALFDQRFRQLCHAHPEFAEAVHSESRGRFSGSATA